MNRPSANPPNSDALQPWPPELEAEALRAVKCAMGERIPQAEAISVASVWQFDSPDEADAVLGGNGAGFAYRRDGHPNERSLASKLALLHGAERAAVTAQGMSAMAALALSQLNPQAVVWIANELYGKTSKLFCRDLARWQVTTQQFDPCDDSQLDRLARSRVDLVFIETISNPRLHVPDIARVASAAHQAGSRLVVDNTFATHLICRPLHFGADFVVESLSKQVNGHSDSMLGLICGNAAASMQSLCDTLSTFGLASSPLDCYLTHRGLMSLGVRLERANANALALARELCRCPQVECVDYPGLVEHASHAHAKLQFSGGYGWMLSFRIPLDRGGLSSLFAALRSSFPFAPSLGDVTTTLSHPASTSHRGLSRGELAGLGIEEGTIRVSCGIEPTDWLVENFISGIRSVA